MEGGRRIERRNRVERPQPIASRSGGRVPRDSRLLCEQRIEQRHLRSPEPHVVAGFRSERERREIAQPVLGQNADTAVAEEHGALAALDGVEQLGKRCPLLIEDGVAAKFEPVHSGSHVDPRRGGRKAEAVAVGLDVPPFANEQPHETGHVARGDLDDLPPLPRVPRGPRAECPQAIVRATLRISLAPCHDLRIARRRERDC